MKHAKKSTFRKVLLIACSAMLLVALSVGVTFAYLTSTKQVLNTFTVGNVQIKLDEVDVTSTNGARTETGNSYYLVPGLSYTKDPTVTVLAHSSASYVRMLVTVNKKAALDKIFADHNDVTLASIFVGYNGTDWQLVGETPDDAKDTRTYEFRYKGIVAGNGGNGTQDNKLPALFTNMVIPGVINNDELASIKDLKITIVAEAIQADGFSTDDLAWAAFSAT